MKKMILLLAVLLGMGFSSEASQSSVNINGDTMVVVDDGDTAIVRGLGMTIIKTKIKNALNDTLFNSEDYGADADDSMVMGIREEHLNNETMMELSETWRKTARECLNSFFGWLAFVIFLCLLFGYLRRRSQNRLIERAIENNYPLPDGAFGHRTNRTVYVPQPQPVYPPVFQVPAAPAATESQTPPPLNGAAQPQSPQGTQSPAVGFFAQTDINWRALYPAYKWIAVGVAAIIFFLAVDAPAPAGLSLVLVFIGLGKGFIAYQEQRSLAQYYRTHPEQMQAPQQPQAAAETSAPSMPPVFNPSDNTNAPA